MGSRIATGCALAMTGGNEGPRDDKAEYANGLVLIATGKFEHLKSAIGKGSGLPDVDQPVTHPEEQMFGGKIFDPGKEMMGEHEIVIGNRDPSEHHGYILPAPAHPESEGELEIVKQIDLSTTRQVKTKELGIPGEAEGEPAQFDRFEFAPGVGKMKVCKEIIPHPSGPQAGPAPQAFLNFVTFAHN